jgi:hypothetical protein
MSFSPRNPKPSLFPTGFGLRLIAMLGALALIGATISTLHHQHQAAREAERAAIERGDRPPRYTPKPAEPQPEKIIAGPTEETPGEQEEMQRFLEVVRDKQPIEITDAPAYLRMLKWSLSQPMAEMERKAKRDVIYAKLWSYPQEHRAELIRMRMHVRRVIRNSGKEVADNPLGLTEYFEVWGLTEDSVNNFFIVIVPELPPGLAVGASSEGDVIFAGYFLKIFRYNSGDEKVRGAPMLVGRIRAVGGGSSKPVGHEREAGLMTMLLIGGGGVCVIILSVTLYRVIRPRRPRRFFSDAVSLKSEVNVEQWLEQGVVPELPPGALAETAPAAEDWRKERDFPEFPR